MTKTAINHQNSKKQTVLVYGIGLFFVMAPIIILGSGPAIKYISTLTRTPITSTTVQTKKTESFVLGSQNNEANFLGITILDSIPISVDGKNYLRLNVTLTNRSGQDLEFSPLLQLKAIDSKGIKHDFTADLSNDPIGGTLSANSEIQGYLDFRISEDVIAYIEFSPYADGKMNNAQIISIP